MDERTPENLIRELFAEFGFTFRQYRGLGGRGAWVYTLVETDIETGQRWEREFPTRDELGEQAMRRLRDVAPASAMRGDFR